MTKTKSIGKKLTAFLMSAAMCTSLFTAMPLSASAEGENFTVTPTVSDLVFEATRDGNNLSVKFKTNNVDGNGNVDFSVLGIGDIDDPDSRAGIPTGVQYSSYSSAFDTADVSDGSNLQAPAGTLIALSGGANGSNLLTMNYTFDNFETGKDYVFTYPISEAVHNDVVTPYSWEGQTFTLTYNEPKPTYTVKFEGEGVSLSDVTVNEGGKVTRPADPTRDGYTFAGWLLNGSAYDFDSVVTANLTLTASWTKNSQTVTGNAVKLSDKLDITKNVQTSVNYDNITFTYTFTNGTFTGQSKTTVTPPVIPDVTVTMSGTESTKTVALPDTVVFPYGGIYTYTVKETNSGTTFWTYDSTEYQIVIEVEENDAGKLEADVVKIKYANGDNAGTKTDKMTFTNSYKPTTTLALTKAVIGDTQDGNTNPLKSNKVFDYKIKFIAPTVNAGGKITAAVKMDGNAAATETEFAYGEEFEFQMKDTGSVTFSNIAEGSTYTVTETGADYYTASAVVKNCDNTTGTETNGTYAEDLTVTGTIARSDNTVDFTNEYSITPPTGVGVNTEVIVISGIVLLALAGMFVINRKIRSKKN